MLRWRQKLACVRPLRRRSLMKALNNNLEHFPLIPRILLAIWAVILALLPVPAMWSIALFGLRLRRPHPACAAWSASRDLSPPGLSHWSARSGWPAA